MSLTGWYIDNLLPQSFFSSLIDLDSLVDLDSEMCLLASELLATEIAVVLLDMVAALGYKRNSYHNNLKLHPFALAI